MPNYTVNNFTAGEVSAKLSGRYDLGTYHNGVARLENFVPMLQGGLSRRSGTRRECKLPSKGRLVSFVISSDLSYLVHITNDKIGIYRANSGSGLYELSNSFDVDLGLVYDELWEIQYTQDYEKLYLVHDNMAPKVLLYTGGAFTFGDMAFVCDEAGEYKDLFKGAGNNPRCVTYCSNRLILASSRNNPYRIWISRPFNTSDFCTYDIVTTDTEVVKPGDQWPSNWQDDPAGILESKTIHREVVMDTNAMVLEVGSNRNDRVEWIIGGSSIVVGTSSSEWIMPATITALSPNITQVSSYGSEPVQGIVGNEDMLFVQSGGKRARAFNIGQQGYSCMDLTYSADHILQAGVKEVHFQRVPEPRVYYVLHDGTVALLSYNKMYGMQAWSKWTFGEGKVVSLSVQDNRAGQSVYLEIERDGDVFLEMIDEGSGKFVDCHNTATPQAYDSVMVSNRLDMPTEMGSTIGNKKKVHEVIFRLLDSGGYRVGYDKLEKHIEEVSQKDVSTFIFGGHSGELQMQVRSVEDKPLTVLAMVLQLEVV